MNNDLTLQSVERLFNIYPDPKRPDQAILELPGLLLNNNDFTFDNQLFLQNMGCSMGLSCIPSLANIFLLEFDERARHGCRVQPSFFSDIWMIVFIQNQMLQNINPTLTH